MLVCWVLFEVFYRTFHSGLVGFRFSRCDERWFILVSSTFLCVDFIFSNQICKLKYTGPFSEYIIGTLEPSSLVWDSFSLGLFSI